MVNVTWKYKPRPDSPRLEAELPRDEAGWIATCAQCGRDRTIYPNEIMSGRWMICPACAASAAEADNEEKPCGD